MTDTPRPDESGWIGFMARHDAAGQVTFEGPQFAALPPDEQARLAAAYAHRPPSIAEVQVRVFSLDPGRSDTRPGEKTAAGPRQQTDAPRPPCVRRLKGEFCIMRADSVAAILRVNRGWARRYGDAGAATPYACPRACPYRRQATTGTGGRRGQTGGLRHGTGVERTARRAHQPRHRWPARPPPCPLIYTAIPPPMNAP
jgi:hypothetical protein